MCRKSCIMNIQTINQSQSINFQKLIINKGSFEALKQSKNFPDKNTENYSENLKHFYKKLMQLKKEAEKNELYNVVFYPDKMSSSANGKVVIENFEGKEQFGFTKSFERMLDIPSSELKHVLTTEEDSNFIDRFIKNWKIKKYNKKIKHNQLSMQEYLNIVYKRIKEMVNGADYLTELHKIKNK